MLNILLNLMVVASTLSPVNKTLIREKQGTAQWGNDFYKGQLDYIIFGVYCGECDGHCATMYKIDSAGLTADSTDSYFKNKGVITFTNRPTKDYRYTKAKLLWEHIPLQLVDSKLEQFGCPDCGDGCGIYVEVKIGPSIKKFLIDTGENQIPEFLRPFAKEVQKVVNEIRPKYF
jgi:hypothetical protein